MGNTSGFYKLENSGEMLYAPNAVFNANYVLIKETKDKYTYPIDGWNWFDSFEVTQSYIDTITDVLTLQQKLKETEIKSSFFDTQLTITKTELSSSKAELIVVKSELVTTKTELSASKAEIDKLKAEVTSSKPK